MEIRAHEPGNFSHLQFAEKKLNNKLLKENERYHLRSLSCALRFLLRRSLTRWTSHTHAIFWAVIMRCGFALQGTVNVWTRNTTSCHFKTKLANNTK